VSVLTYLTDTQIQDAGATITGKTLTRPQLLATDGSVLAYVVDVDIGAQPVDMTPSHSVTTTTAPITFAVTTIETTTQVVNGTTVTTVKTTVTNPPAAPIVTTVVTKDATTSGQSGSVILRDVPVARNNRELVFADAGAAVTLTRTANGRYMVTGLSNELPGTYTVFTVDLGTFSFGPVVDLSLVGRPLTLGELASLGSFGVTPLGATGLFKGGVLQEINV
jgi:hypothetical protein